MLIVGLQISENATLAQERGYILPFHTVNGLILLDAKVNGKRAVLLLDTGAIHSIVDKQSAGLGNLALHELDSMGGIGAAGNCSAREVHFTLGGRDRTQLVCLLDLAVVSKRVGAHLDGFIGQDVLREFSAVRIDYKAHTVTLEMR